MRKSIPIAALGLALTAACSTDRVPADDRTTNERSVTITTTACGHSSHTVGTGVVIESGVVLTAAHVVIGATDVLIDDDLPAMLTRLDAARDLATLSVATPNLGAVQFVTLANGQRATVAAATHSEPIDVTVNRHVALNIDDVRGQARHDRGGYLLSGRIAAGDSGAGLFAGERLAGLVFAVASNGEPVTYAIDAAEIIEFLAIAEPASYQCDPNSSRVIVKPKPAR